MNSLNDDRYSSPGSISIYRDFAGVADHYDAIQTHASAQLWGGRSPWIVRQNHVKI